MPSDDRRKFITLLGSRDVPPRFNVRILEGVAARAAINGPKGIGEPPIHLATAVWTALTLRRRRSWSSRQVRAPQPRTR